jgi:hypothetical protein
MRRDGVGGAQTEAQNHDATMGPPLTWMNLGQRNKLQSDRYQTNFGATFLRHVEMFYFSRQHHFCKLQRKAGRFGASSVDPS